MAAKEKRGLGIGLDALFGPDLQTEPDEIRTLPLSQVEPRQDQPRESFDEERLQDLAASISRHGLIQPVIVRRLEDGYYQIIAGERRWRAARLAGLREVPAVIIEADDRKAMELALIENLQREDLNPIEEAEGYKTLIETYRLTQEQAAESVGKSRSTVANAMRLLALEESVLEDVRTGRISAGHARALLPLSEKQQKEAAQLIFAQNLSVRQTEALVKKLTTEKKDKPISPEEALRRDYAQLAARELGEKLGRGVNIVSGRKKGRLELEYYGLDDLNELLEALALLKTRKGGEKK